MRAAVASLLKRVCLREQIRHGEENAAFLQRVDARRANLGKASSYKKMEEAPQPKETIRGACEARIAPHGL